jgi:glycine/D-amino acid oxidase-like deaminating enzyme
VETMRTDVVIVGGGVGACAAALAAARLGRRVILTEETRWVGSQLTNQVVPPDEHPWIEQFGATASYRTLRRGIRDYYRAHLPLTPEARASSASSTRKTCSSNSRLAVAGCPKDHVEDRQDRQRLRSDPAALRLRAHGAIVGPVPLNRGGCIG